MTSSNTSSSHPCVVFAAIAVFMPLCCHPSCGLAGAAFGFDSGRVIPVHGAEVVREGDGTVRLRMASAEWSCGLRLDPPEGLRSFDLSGAKWLAVDVENVSTSRQMRLTMHISSGGANSEAADRSSSR